MSRRTKRTRDVTVDELSLALRKAIVESFDGRQLDIVTIERAFQHAQFEIRQAIVFGAAKPRRANEP